MLAPNNVIPLDSKQLAVRAKERNAVVRVEQAILDGKFGKPVLRKDTESWTIHHFTPGVYAREINIPKGMVLTGKIHKHSHLNVISKGQVSVVDGTGGVKSYVAPFTFVSEPGIKRVLVTHTDITWTTIHPNPDNITDLAVLEDMFTCDDYKQLTSVGEGS